jgi:hypothetical protein
VSPFLVLRHVRKKNTHTHKWPTSTSCLAAHRPTELKKRLSYQKAFPDRQITEDKKNSSTNRSLRESRTFAFDAEELRRKISVRTPEKMTLLNIRVQNTADHSCRTRSLFDCLAGPPR